MSLRTRRRNRRYLQDLLIGTGSCALTLFTVVANKITPERLLDAWAYLVLAIVCYLLHTFWLEAEHD